jgi:hypothetical protein
MIAIDVWLFIAGGFALYTLGFFTAAILSVGGRSDVECECSLWKKKYADLLNKLKDADETIYTLSEEKANLKDSVTFYEKETL